MTNIVLDLEWNQPVDKFHREKGLYGEIIQIGAAKITDQCEVIDDFSIMVKPFFYKKMNREISELTLITTEELYSHGIPFEEAIRKFRQWCGEDFLFISWSESDLQYLKNNLEVFGMDTSWLPPSYDAQLVFDDYEMQEDKSWPLNYALYHFKEKPDGAHNALSDVYSTIAVLKHLDLPEALRDPYFRYDEAYKNEDSQQ